eukprot:367220-Pyramimonas_sp.AAC.1
MDPLRDRPVVEGYPMERHHTLGTPATDRTGQTHRFQRGRPLRAPQAVRSSAKRRQAPFPA